MDNAVTSKKLPIKLQEDPNSAKPQSAKSKTQQKPQAFEEEQQNPVSTFLREQFFFLMKKVQKEGVGQFQHFKRPYVYTGSWMEGVRTVEDLYQRIKEIPNVCEAVIRTFNILCPFDEPLPKGIGDKEAITKFYGDPWFDGMEEDQRQQNKVALSEQESRVQALEMALNVSKTKLGEALENEAARTCELEQLKKKLSNYVENQVVKETAGKKIDAVVKEKDKILNDYEMQIQQLQEQLQAKDQEIEEFKEQAQYLNENAAGGGVDEEQFQEVQDKYQEVQEELTKVKMQLDSEQQKEKFLREKAGGLFLQAMNEAKERAGPAAAATNIKKEQQGDEQTQNMQDDEAIIKMFQALKSTPTVNLRQRLIKADINGDNKLSQDEFNRFCKDLGLSPVDTHSLSRIAKLLDGKNMVGIDEFIQILQERPKMREMWEKQLFKRLLKIIKSNNLTIERFFDLVDVDSSQSVTMSEFKEGLEALRIVLNKSDLISIFTIFDKNHDGTISLDEMKNTLDYYEKLPDEEEQKLNFDERMKGGGQQQEDEFDEGNNDFTKTQKLGLTKVQMEEGWSKSDDLMLLNGDLKIQIPWGKGLLDESKLKQVIIRIQLRGAIEPMPKAVLMVNKNNWGFAVRVPVRWTLEENLSNFLNIQLWSQGKFDDDTFFLGELFIKWKECLKQPEKWAVNMQQPLENVSFGDKEPKKEVSGELGVQAKWIHAASREFHGKIIEFSQIVNSWMQKQFVSSCSEDGRLCVGVVMGVFQKNNRQKGILCVVRMPGGTEKELVGDVDAQGNPCWNETVQKEIKVKANTETDAVICRIKQDVGALKRDKLLGEVVVDWSECLKYPTEFLTKRAFIFPLGEKLGEEVGASQQQQNENVSAVTQGMALNKLYLKIRWIPKSMYHKFIETEKSGKQAVGNQLQKEGLKKGILKIIIMRAKNLKATNDCDPYCIIRYNNKLDKDIVWETPNKTKTVNPEWIAKKELEINYGKDGPFAPLEVIVKDSDALKDAFIGNCMVDLTELLTGEPCAWRINHYFELNVDEKKQDSTFSGTAYDKTELLEGKPQIYLQAYFVPEGVQDKNVQPADREDRVALAPAGDIIKGMLKLIVVHAKGLIKTDFSIIDKAGLSDPYVVVTFPDMKEEETKPICNTVNPVWNQKFEKVMKVSKDKLKPISFVIKDEDADGDDLLGFVNVDLGDCLKAPGTWAVNEIFQVEGQLPQNQKALSNTEERPLGELYVQMKWLDDGMVDDNSKPTLLVNLQEELAGQSGVYKGNLRIKLIHCKNCCKLGKEKINYQVVFKVPGGELVKSREMETEKNPVWDLVYNVKIVAARTMIQPIRIEVKDQHTFGTTVLGFKDLPIDECFKNSCKWIFNEIVPLNGDETLRQKYKEGFGEVYMQIMFVGDGDEEKANGAKVPGLIEDLEAKNRQEKMEEDKVFKGILSVNVVMARGVKAADGSGTSDPFVEIRYLDGKMKETQVIKKSVNPVWNFECVQMINWSMKLIKEKKLQLVVKDKDKVLGISSGSDALGIAEVDLLKCFENVGLWIVNNAFKLQGEQKFGQQLGELYLQVKFNLETDSDIDKKKHCETVEELIKDYGWVNGPLTVDIISGNGFKSAKNMQCTCYLSTQKGNCLKTKDNESSVTPQWNYQGQLQLNMRKIQVQNIKVIVDVESPGLITTTVGKVELALLDVLGIPNGQPLCKEFEIKDGQKFKGFLKMQLKFNANKEKCERIEDLQIPEKMVQGRLNVIIPNARALPDTEALGTPDPFAEALISNDLNKVVLQSPQINNNLNPDWNYPGKIEINLKESELPGISVIFQVMNKCTLSNSVLGGTSILLGQLVQYPGTWINKYYQLKNKDGNKSRGYIYIQMQYESAGIQLTAQQLQIPAVQSYQDYLQSIEPPKIKGQLYIKIIAAKNLNNEDLGGASDSYCSVKFSKEIPVIKKTKVKDNDLNPFWDESFEDIELALTKEQMQQQNLIVEVYDYDSPDSDYFLGRCLIELDGLFKSAGMWFNDWKVLMNEKGYATKGEIYLQVQWREQGKKIETGIPENKYEELQKKKQEEMQAKLKKEEEEKNQKKVVGKLAVNIIKGRGIKNMESMPFAGVSDPYVEVGLNRGSQDKILTKTVDNLSPVWDCNGKELNISLPEKLIEGEYLCVRLMDKNPGLSDKFIGSATIELDQSFKEPGKWSVNKYVECRDEKGKEVTGQVYIQCQWRPEGMYQIDTTAPAVNEEDKQKQAEQFEGEMEIQVIEARGLKSSWSDKCDGFVVVRANKMTLRNVQQLQTEERPDNLNPKWDFTGTLAFRLTEEDFSTLKLTLELRDKDNYSSDFVGQVWEYDKAIFQTPSQWIERNRNLMDEKYENTTQGTLHYKVMWKGPALFGISQPVEQPKQEQNQQKEQQQQQQQKQQPAEQPKLEQVLPKEQQQQQQQKQQPAEQPKQEQVQSKEQQQQQAQQPQQQKVNQPEQKVAEKPKEEAPKEEAKQVVNDLVKGTLTINFLNGKNFPRKGGFTMDKDPDPYCIAKILVGSFTQSIESKHATDQINPEWNEKKEVNISVKKQEPMKYLIDLKTLDEDYGGDALFGEVQIDMTKIFMNPSESINENYVLKSKGKETKMTVSLQISWKETS